MAVNLDKPARWKADIARSVDMYNDWFMSFAPEAFRQTRTQTAASVRDAFDLTGNMTVIQAAVLRQHPEILPALRMSTCPPLAMDRLTGLAGVAPNLVKSMEIKKLLPSRTDQPNVDRDLARIVVVIQKLADPDILVWLGRARQPTEVEVNRAATIIADRLCGAVANPIVRNAQERRQLAALTLWLENRGYELILSGTSAPPASMPPGSFALRKNVSVHLKDGVRQVKLPIDLTVMPKKAKSGSLPLFFEAKSAGDFTNTNKRRKEEAVKVAQLRATYGEEVQFSLFLCGYFDSGYLGYEAAEGIDWVWEHRIDDLALFGL